MTNRGVPRRFSAAATAIALAGSLLSAPFLLTRSVPTGNGHPDPVDRDTVVAGRPLAVRPRVQTPPAAKPTVRWPSGEFTAGGAHVRVLDRAAADRAGVHGLLLSVTAPATTDVPLDYTGFAEAFGGGYGSRLRLVRLPECALTTPERAGCRAGTPVPATNDTRSKTLTTSVSPGATVLAVTSDSSSARGDYRATPLAASATWNVGTQSGAFTWSYPLRVPPVPGNLVPTLAATYSSSSLDGRVSGTNNQGAWVGDGFDLWPGFIERKYRACKDDGVPKDSTYQVYPGDQCWAYDNATLAFGGKGGELIPAGGNLWRMRDDDGTRVEELTGTASDTGNGDNDNEYWRVTTPDGTRYYFGKNRWSGWASGTRETNSAFTTPVYGDDSGEPCHDTTFADSWCQQAWRWNLDFVEDTHGNAIAYYYTEESNHYGRNLRATDETPYTRAGYLTSVMYGLRSGAMYPADPPARVDFTVAERCLRATASDCAESNITAHPEYWADTPWDLHCDAGAGCRDDHGTVSPTFWTRKRLTTVTTKILKSDGTYRAVDTWSFAHAWGTADVDRQLLLASITHTGVAGSQTVALPPVTFAYTQLANRVDKLGDDIGPMVKNRIGAIYNEYGGQLDVNYTPMDCTATDLPNPADNHRRCFPTYWTKTSGDENPTLDWFHKYVVAQTVQTDLTGGAPDMVTGYDYSIGQPAWHYADDDGLTPEKYKTWSQWHGYSKVRVATAGGGRTDYWYFQGMDGDRASASGGTRSVSVTDGEGGSYPDHESLQGMTLRTVTYNNGAAVRKSVTTPWHHQTASRTRSWGTVTANLTGTKITRDMTLVDTTWRETWSTTTTFDLTTGEPTQVDDAGDTAVTGDEACTDTMFTANGTRVLARPAEVRTVARPCGTTPDLTRDVIADVRTYYDNGSFAAAPTVGDVTRVEKATAPSTYVPTARTTYDGYGRPLTVTNAENRVTTTAYTDTAGLNTRMKVTSPPAAAGDASTALTTATDLDPAWGNPVQNTDAGGKTTITAYDALGRLAKVWTPGRSTTLTPDREFTYAVAADTVTAVATKTLTNDGGQLISYTLYDGWLRLRQVQAPGRGDNGTAGRLITDTFYNPAGLTDHSYDAYYADGAPQPTLFGVATPGQIETQHWYTYDDLGRTTTDRLLIGNSDANERWRTRYEYGGNWSRVIPPGGGITVTTYTDAHDRRTEVREGSVPTTFAYNPHGQLATVTGPGGNTWTTSYDFRGRKSSETDPDKGTTTYRYDDMDRVVLTTDARGMKIGLTYDGIGRQIARYDATTASPGTKLAEWTYDTVRKGHLTRSTRWAGGKAYTNQIDFYDNLNRPTRIRVLLPSTEGALAPTGGWVFDTSYNLDGTIKATGSPAAGSLPAENTTFTYDPLGRLVQAGSNLSTYLTATAYSKTGKLIGQKLSTGGTEVSQTFGYEYGTQRLQHATTAHSGTAGTDRGVTYRYADGGNITQIVDTSRDGIDNQCFTYDALARLTNAWTQAGTGDCAADPTTVTVGGIAAYRAGYSYDDAGNRTGDAIRTYTYGRGHRLASVSDGSAYDYDADGNTTYRRTPTSAGWQRPDRTGDHHVDRYPGGTNPLSEIVEPGQARCRVVRPCLVRLFGVADPQHREQTAHLLQRLLHCGYRSMSVCV
jgi:YD repeat-containing protein